MRFALLAAVLIAVTGCQGEVTELDSDRVTWNFAASVQVNPSQPVAGRNVSLNIELTSHSKTEVLADVWVRVIRGGTKLVYEESFRGVKLVPEEIWNLSQGFLPATDDGGAPLDIEILVRDHETGEILWSAPHAGAFVLG